MNKKQAHKNQHRNKKHHTKQVKRQSKNYLPNIGPRVSHTGNGVYIVVVPKHLSCYDAKVYETSQNFLKTIERLAKQNNTNNIILDFKDTVTLKSIDSVLLFATIETLIRTTKIRFSIQFSRIHNFTKEIQQSLNSSGISILCADNAPKITFDDETLPIISGVGGDYRDEIVDFLMKKIYKNNMDALLENKYSSAIQEAINNVTAHAYKNTSDSRWWLKCSYFPEGKELYLIIYDNGVGIPNTFLPKDITNSPEFEEFLKTKDVFEEMKKHLRSQGHIFDENLLPKNKNQLSMTISDELRIFAAMSGNLSGRSSEEKLRKHGQGSISIRNLVKNNDNGILWVFSNHGLVKYYGDKMGTKHQLIKLPKPLKGTLIQWNIKVEI